MIKRDDLAARLRATFLAELEDQLRVMNADLLALERVPSDAARLRSLFRVAHTLKGASRAASVPLLEEVCHSLEALLASARDGAVRLDAGHFSLLFGATDALANAGQRLLQGESLAGSPLDDLRGRLRDAERAARASAPAADRRGAAEARSTPTDSAAVSSGASGAAPVTRGEAQLRVDADSLDALLASAVQLRLAAAPVSARSAELRELEESVRRCTVQWHRAASRLQQVAERSGTQRMLLQTVAETDEQLRRLGQDAARLADRATADAQLLGRVSDQITDRARRIRMRPFSEAVEALPRAVRDLAQAESKDVRLVLAGTEVKADRTVLDALRDPILHLVRNAVDHGVEAPAVREAAGKAATATVRVEALLEADRLTVKVSDDGRGLDTATLRERLEYAGRAVSGDDEIASALLEGGISSKAAASRISGRGVGLDLVRDALERIGGTVEIAWRPGEGATITLQSPVTLASVRVVLLSVRPQIFALPTACVERLARIDPSQVRRVEGREVMIVEGSPVPLASLASLLGPPFGARPLEDRAPVVVLRVGGRRAAFAVDELLSEEEVVVRPLGRGASGSLPHVSGAALLAGGGVAVVLSAEELAATAVSAASVPGATITGSPQEKRRASRILVVDDSITTRTLEQSVLEAAGYEVLTAVDGADAWHILQHQMCDLVVSDVEMPRMDGFSLCHAIRASKRLQKLPVVLVTALETQEHRERGLEAGADAYIGKSSFDQQALLETVAQLLTEAP